MWGLRICISDVLPGDAEVAGLDDQFSLLQLKNFDSMFFCKSIKRGLETYPAQTFVSAHFGPQRSQVCSVMTPCSCNLLPVTPVVMFLCSSSSPCPLRNFACQHLKARSHPTHSVEAFWGEQQRTAVLTFTVQSEVRTCPPEAPPSPVMPAERQMVLTHEQAFRLSPSFTASVTSKSRFTSLSLTFSSVK